MNIHKQLLALSMTFIGAGMIIAAPITVSLLDEQSALTSASEPLVSTTRSAIADTPEIIKGIPKQISVPSLGISTTVNDGYYDAKTGHWTLSEESAFFATPTDPINSSTGNTLIYGHNSDKLFGKLLSISDGALVHVTTDNGYEFTYIYQSTEAVKPTDVSVLIYSGKPRLTLQTCSGIWNQTRQMFYFELQSYKKI